MTNEELVLLFQHDNGKDTMQQLYLRNKGLIAKVVRPFISYVKCDEDDLMQIGFLGMMEAARRYDPNKGGSFSSYFPYWVRASVFRSDEYMTGRSATRLPSHIRQQINQYHRIVTEYQKQTGGNPSDRYIMFALKINQDQLDNLKQIIDTTPLSLDAELKWLEGMTIADTIPDTNDPIETVIDATSAEMDAKVLWKEVDALEEQERTMICDLYVEGNTPASIADRFGLTRNQVRSALDRVYRKLRHNQTVRRIAKDRGYFSRELYGGSLSCFLHSGSLVEAVAIRRVEGRTDKNNEQ